jgi:uncharacterized Zn finger protein (UPF0148 family)
MSKIAQLMQMLGILTGDTCPMCGATGDMIHKDPETGSQFCLACIINAAADLAEQRGGSPENAKEIRERVRLAKQGVELPPWEDKVSKKEPSSGTE